MSSLLLLLLIDEHSDNIDSDTPRISLLVDDVTGRLVLAGTARPNAHELVGLEHEAFGELELELRGRVDASLEHPLCEIDVFVARRVL